MTKPTNIEITCLCTGILSAILKFICIFPIISLEIKEDLNPRDKLEMTANVIVTSFSATFDMMLIIASIKQSRSLILLWICSSFVYIVVSICFNGDYLTLGLIWIQLFFVLIIIHALQTYHDYNEVYIV